MTPPLLPSTCLSEKPHDHRVSNPTIHFNGCLRGSKRLQYYDDLPPQSKQRIQRDNDRITDLRRRLETSQCDSMAGLRLRGFKSAMAQWCLATNRPSTGYTPIPRVESRRPSGMTSYMGADDNVNRHIKAPVMYFRDGKPIDIPGIPNQFPNQKVTMSDLLSQDEAKNLLMQPCDDNIVRYFHLPANNMAWVEEVIARYYHESRPSSVDMLLQSKALKSKNLNDMTKTEMLLRPEYWHGQQNFDADSEVHARHMRPFCESISVDPTASERRPKNLVLFMPYLHWESDRGRLMSAELVKEAGKQKMRSIAEIANQAQHHMSRMQTHDTVSPVLERPPSSNSSLLCVDKRKALGQVFRAAAALLEAMDLHTEEQLMGRYLHSDPPLHPRRTLDQSYYGALKNTGTRDRDQVVYRGTTPEPHDCDGMAECEKCNEDIRKVPRIVMVDQLWLWVLDEKTVITSFPRRWGKNRPDPSAIHKNLRIRLRCAREGDVSSVYDLALMIVDQCSRVFFDRTKANERQPHLVELFTGAIRDLTYKQTAAFDQFLIYTHLASRDYKRERYITTDNSTQNTLLNINPEGNLLKEVKDIMDEIHIMLRIKEQQHNVMEGLVKHIRRAFTSRLQTKRQPGGPPSSFYSQIVEDGTSLDDNGGSDMWKVRRTLDRTDNLLTDLDGRTSELQALLQNAQNTSAALKDLLTLKQQQAGVIEAREAVKQAQLTLKQGQSIMIFTIVTIIFLPLSFCVGLFGMNAIEFNDGLLPLSTEFKYMFPVSAGIILISFLFAFSQTVLSNSIVMLCRSAVSFAYNTIVTWLLVKTGLYMAGREMAAQAHRLRDKEATLTGSMKAEVLRKEKNLERMRAAGHVKRLAKKTHDSETGRSDTAMGTLSGRTTPFSPYMANTPAPGSPFFPATSHNPASGRLQRKSPGVSMEEIDVELGDRNRHHDDVVTQRKMTFRQLV